MPPACTFNKRNADFSCNWITSGLPTTRTSALTLYASVEIGRSLFGDSGNSRRGDSHPACVSAPNHLAARRLANLNLTRVISLL
jgi:hypothetical protein